MIPTLEDVARITGLRVDGQAVTGVTYTSYQEMVERLLGLEVMRERSSLVQRTRLQASLGVADTCHQTGEGQAEYMGKLTADARAVLAEEEGAVADRDLRRFLILMIGKLILGTRGDPVSCQCLPLLEDLTRVGSYAWGATLLAHLFDSLGTSSRETGVAGFFPLLQVWAYHYLLSLGRGVLRRPGVVPFLQRWRFRRDERSLRQQVTLIHDALDIVPFGHGRPYFGRDIWLHAFNTVVPLHLRLVTRTLGLHQATVEFSTWQRSWERSGRSFRGIQQVTDWTVRLDPEGQIASLEGVLHSTIQQRDDLQQTVTQLRTELLRAQQMVGGAFTSRDELGRSVLEGQLAVAVRRAEDAAAELLEREADLRASLARIAALEKEMAEMGLRPQTDEASGLRREADDLRSQLGSERHHYELLRSEMKGLERALALVRRSRSSASRSGIPSESAGHYLTGSSGRRRNEEEARRCEGAAEGSTTGPRDMAPPPSRPPEGTGESC
ncbi:hypothetical protein Taro_005751 [Colocasia esculenta]|uniref:Aminotransferase-like plant mobile domain-containing protein n=1 Tax=Colocasia esculenta TaxID=4460 RepID=A0A843TTB6_COLES|nr:hypothetical protein [Colocasia esculenta]